MVGLDKGDVAHSINPYICFLTKGQEAENLKQSKDSVLSINKLPLEFLLRQSVFL